MAKNKGRFLRLPPDVHEYLDACMAEYRNDPEPGAGYFRLPCRVVSDAIRKSSGFALFLHMKHEREAGR